MTFLKSQSHHPPNALHALGGTKVYFNCNQSSFFFFVLKHPSSPSARVSAFSPSRDSPPTPLFVSSKDDVSFSVLLRHVRRQANAGWQNLITARGTRDEGHCIGPENEVGATKSAHTYNQRRQTSSTWFVLPRARATEHETKQQS